MNVRKIAGFMLASSPLLALGVFVGPVIFVKALAITAVVIAAIMGGLHLMGTAE